MSGIAVSGMRASDWDEVRRIYAEGIATGNATMETAPPPWESWNEAHRPDCRLVARDGGRMLGWAALSRVSERCAYGGVAEVSVYVSQEARGRGVGRRLLEELVRASEEAGIWTLQAGIFPENAASLSIHQHCGFRVVGVREKLGKLGSAWRDVALLERRSERVGT
ncbi:MAG TPA: GNAT family N-acetyltransferase [Thermoanaerobaculia bacterium]|nr:GNAT family N-acetyltransferase [Thermoanaerobaculia bacterium]